MPDDSSIARIEQVARAQNEAFEAWHRELLHWGLCYLRGGGRDVDIARPDIVRVNNKTKEEAIYRETTTTYREPDPSFERRDWTQPDIDRAARIHGRVLMLPTARSLVLQVFYFEEDAKDWANWDLGRIADLTIWPGQPLGVNPRIRQHNRDMRQRYGPTVEPVPLIVPEAFLAIRHRAIRELMARDRGMPR